MRTHFNCVKKYHHTSNKSPVWIYEYCHMGAKTFADKFTHMLFKVFSISRHHKDHMHHVYFMQVFF